MPTLSRFTEATLPDPYAHQIRDFIRIRWFDAYQFDLHAPIMPPEWQAIFYVLVEEHVLFSHATTVIREVTCAGQTYRGGGLSGVFTYPAFEKRGYGAQVVRAATDSQTADAFDVAILWTSPPLVGFYQKASWEHHPAVEILKGHPDHPEKMDALVMIRFLSDRARANQTIFLTHPIYIGEHSW